VQEKFAVEEEPPLCITEMEGFNVHTCTTDKHMATKIRSPTKDIGIPHTDSMSCGRTVFLENTLVVIPACVVNAIKTKFPSEQYCGFKYPPLE
jgi:hypothetical protein